MSVVVDGVLGEDSSEMVCSQDQRSGPGARGVAFRSNVSQIAVRSGRLRRGEDDLYTSLSGRRIRTAPVGCTNRNLP